MNANASPLYTKVAARVSPGTGMIVLAEKLDQGFDQLVANHATHRMRDAAQGQDIRTDLAQLMAYPGVTFAAGLPDGTTVLCCPKGLPPQLQGRADPLAGRPILPPQPLQDQTELATMLDRLEHKLDDLMASRPEADHAIAQALAALDARIDGLTPRPVDLAPVLKAIENTTQSIVARPSSTDQLSRIEAALRDLSSRPAPQPDLTLQRLSFANFLTSMSTIIKRMEAAADHLATPGLTAEQDARLQGIESLVLAQADRVPDLAPLMTLLSDMQSDIAQGSGTAAALGQLSTQIEGLLRRPDPVLDLTKQRQSFARFAVALGTTVQRLENAAEVFERAPTIPQAAATPVPPDAAPDNRPNLADHASQAEAPALDLTDLRQSLAGFSSALSGVTGRLEALGGREPTLSTAPQGFDQHLRFAMAETLAQQIKLLSGKA